MMMGCLLLITSCGNNNSITNSLITTPVIKTPESSLTTIDKSDVTLPVLSTPSATSTVPSFSTTEVVPTTPVAPTTPVVPTTSVVPTTPVVSTTIPLVPSTQTTTAITTSISDIDYSNAIFASPAGTGNGSISDPFSLQTALSNLSNDKILYLLEGTYHLESNIVLNSVGSYDSYFKIFAYKDEKVVLDFGKDYSKDQTITGNYNKDLAKGIVLKGEFYHLKGLTITNCGAHGLQISGSYNIVENCVFAKNGNTGCDIDASSNKAFEDWPHDNLIKNCTSYGNYDWDRYTSQGEDADGFGCKLTSGINNVFDGCIAYNNSDDGWDLFTKHLTGPIGTVKIINCVAFSNGYSLDGKPLMNGNGFKLGGRAIEVSHIVENSVAFFNKSNGFDDNSNPGTISLSNCTSFKNGSRNYAMGRFLNENNTYTSQWYENGTLFGPIYNVPKSHNIFKNCISYEGGKEDSYCGVASNCYFYANNNSFNYFQAEQECNSAYVKGNNVNSFNPFISLEIDLTNLEEIHYIYRDNNYNIDLASFLRLKEEYRLGAKLY